MKLECPQCGKNVEMGKQSRFDVFACKHCNHHFRGIHADHGLFEGILAPVDFVARFFYTGGFLLGGPKRLDIRSTPCPHCGVDITLGVRLSKGVNTNEVCYSCNNKLPTDFIDNENLQKFVLHFKDGSHRVIEGVNLEFAVKNFENSLDKKTHHEVYENLTACESLEDFEARQLEEQQEAERVKYYVLHLVNESLLIEGRTIQEALNSVSSQFENSEFKFHETYEEYEERGERELDKQKYVIRFINGEEFFLKGKSLEDAIDREFDFLDEDAVEFCETMRQYKKRVRKENQQAKLEEKLEQERQIEEQKLEQERQIEEEKLEKEKQIEYERLVKEYAQIMIFYPMFSAHVIGEKQKQNIIDILVKYAKAPLNEIEICELPLYESDLNVPPKQQFTIVCKKCSIPFFETVFGEETKMRIINFLIDYLKADPDDIKVFES